MTTRAQWASRFQEAMDSGQLVVTPAEYEEIRTMLVPSGPGPADALSTVFRGLVAGSMSLRLVVGEPGPPSRAEVLLAVEAQSRMERRMGLPPAAPRHRYIGEDSRRVAWDLVNRRIVTSMGVPRDIARVTEA